MLKDVKELNLTVSSGPNYDKKFILQNLVGLNIDDAMKIINENFMNNVTIDYEISDSISKDIIISQNINGEIKRNDALELVVSLGTEDDLIPFSMIDLKGKSLFEASLWLKRNGIKYEINYEFSDNVSKNYCISQSEKEGTTINPKEQTITIIVSKGKEIIIPDFTSMSVSDATKWVTENNLKLKFTEEYDNEIEMGSIIASSYPINSKVEEGTLIELTISKGKLKMEQFDSITSFRAWADGLNLQYEEDSEFNESISGTIISINPNVGEYINLNETIKVVYSKGPSTTIPNFYGKTYSSASSLCTSSKLKCSFSYRYSNTVEEGYIMSQSMSSGSTVAQNTSITLYISKGKEVVTPVCDKSKTVTVYLTSGNDGAQTKTLITKSYPNINWNFKFVTSCSNGSVASGTICNGQSYDAKNLNYCDTYTLEIVE